jgi:hypothetical protein
MSFRPPVAATFSRVEDIGALYDGVGSYRTSAYGEKDLRYMRRNRWPIVLGNLNDSIGTPDTFPGTTSTSSHPVQSIAHHSLDAILAEPKM